MNAPLPATDVGIASLTDIQSPTVDGRNVTTGERHRRLVVLGETAERLGLDHIGIGEHHSPDFAVSSPAVVLAAIAARTSTIRLTSSVSTLSTLDPVRLYEDFATLDLVSAGRAEVTVGRSAYPDPFRLFGVPMEKYDAVFEEKLELFLRVRGTAHVTWRGRFRSGLDAAAVVPRAQQDPLPVWVGVGGTPESAERAGRLGLPMMLGYIGGPAERLAYLAARYRAAGEEAGTTDRLRLGLGVHFFATDSAANARDTYPYYRSSCGPRVRMVAASPYCRSSSRPVWDRTDTSWSGPPSTSPRRRSASTKRSGSIVSKPWSTGVACRKTRSAPPWSTWAGPSLRRYGTRPTTPLRHRIGSRPAHEAPRPRSVVLYEDTVPPRQRRTDARRNRVKVLTAATDLYAARGLEVSLNEIARHAKVGIATLQRNFPQREDLVAEVFAPRVREYADAAEAAAENPDPWAAFRGYVELVCRMQCEDRGFAAVLNTSFPASAELEAERRRALRGFTRLVRRAKEAGVLRGDFSPHDLPLFLLANAGWSSEPAPTRRRRHAA